MSTKKLFAAADVLATKARNRKDGSYAISTYGHSPSTVLVATNKHPERLALLKALHESWFPTTDAGDDA